MNKILTKFLLAFMIILLCVFLASKKVKADYNFPYSDDIVNNMAAAMTSELGCGQRDYFVYQLVWDAVFMNNYNRLVGINTPITLQTMCQVFAAGSLYNPEYCYLDFGKNVNKGKPNERTIQCTENQKVQIRKAARLVLGRSFNIPSNIYMAAEDSVIAVYGITWMSFTPTGGWRVNYAYENNKTLSNKDIYGNTIRTDTGFYHSLAECLYDNPQYNTYNSCNGGTPLPSSSGNPSSGAYDDYTEEINGDRCYYPERKIVRVSKCQPATVSVPKCITNYGIVIRNDLKNELNMCNTGSSSSSKKSSSSSNKPASNSSSSNKPENSSSSKPENSSSSSSSSDPSVTNYLVTFYMNDGSGETYRVVAVKAGSKVSEPEKPVKEDKTFYGWMTSDSKWFDFNTKINSNIDLYAVWGPKNGKSGGDPSNPGTGVGHYLVFIIAIVSLGIAINYYKKTRENYEE